MTDRALMLDRLERFLAMTPRQQQIARLYAEGRSLVEVADAACIQPQTAKALISTVYQKLGMTGNFSKCRELSYLLGYVDGMNGRRLRMVTHRNEEAA